MAKSKKLFEKFINATSVDEKAAIYARIKARNKRDCFIWKTALVIGKTALYIDLVLLFMAAAAVSVLLGFSDFESGDILPIYEPIAKWLVAPVFPSHIVIPCVIFISIPLWIGILLGIVRLFIPAKGHTLYLTGSTAQRAKALMNEIEQMNFTSVGFPEEEQCQKLSSITVIGFYVAVILPALVIGVFVGNYYVFLLLLPFIGYIIAGYISYRILSRVYYAVINKLWCSPLGVNSIDYVAYKRDMFYNLDKLWVENDPLEKERRKEEARKGVERREEEERRKARERAETELWVLQKKREGYTYQPDGHGGYKFGPSNSGKSPIDADPLGYYDPDPHPIYDLDVAEGYKDPPPKPDPESMPDSSSIW